MPALPITRQGARSSVPSARPRLITIAPWASDGGAMATGAPSISCSGGRCRRSRRGSRRSSSAEGGRGHGIGSFDAPSR